MNTDGFFAFYNALYTGDNGNEVINALRYRKITLEKWKKDIILYLVARKRKIILVS